LLLRDIYATHDPAISVEFFPPKTPQGEANLARRIPVIKALKLSFCSVTYGAGGSTRNKTMWWVYRLKHEFGLEVMCHLTCVGQSRDDIQRILKDLKSDLIYNIIALRGDPPADAPDWQAQADGYAHAIELVRAAKASGPFSIAVAGFPETHPDAVSREADICFLKEKVDAGADAVITQLFFDNDDFLRYVEEARRAGVTVPIVPGILPIRSAAQVRRFTKLSKSRIPPALEQRLALVGDDNAAALQLGIDYATDQCVGLLREGTKALHFYCLNESHSVEAILRNLNLRGTPGSGV
jgi:methylenetetrahydrofolate reductase (NADPH)